MHSTRTRLIRHRAINSEQTLCGMQCEDVRHTILDKDVNCKNCLKKLNRPNPLLERLPDEKPTE